MSRPGVPIRISTPVLQLFALLLIAGAAEHHGGAETGVFGEDFRIPVNLYRQFPGRGQDQGAGLIGAASLVGRVFDQVLQGGDQKGRGLAGAGLGLAGQVLCLSRRIGRVSAWIGVQ